MSGEGAMTPSDDARPAAWNGQPIPPRPPLPEPTDEDTAVEPARRSFIGMPPGMQADIDTVPAGEHAAVPPPGVAAEPDDSAEAPQLVFPDGLRVGVTGSILIGRDPSAQDAFPDASFVPVADRTISKTHAAVQWSHGTVWVSDLNSTNGTRIVDIAGRDTVCVAGVATPAHAGGGILFGSVLVSLASRDSDGSL